MKHLSLNLTIAAMHLDIALLNIYSCSGKKELSQTTIMKLKGFRRRLDNCIRHHEMQIDRRKAKRCKKDFAM